MKKKLIKTPYDSFVDTIKEDIHNYSNKCGEILNWGEIHYLAKIIASRGSRNIDHPSSIGNFSLVDLEALIYDIKVKIAGQAKWSIDKVEFAFLYCLEVCSNSINLENSYLPKSFTLLITKQIRIFISKAKLDNNENSLFAKENNIIKHFPIVQSCLPVDSEEEIKKKKLRRRNLKQSAKRHGRNLHFYSFVN